MCYDRNEQQQNGYIIYKVQCTLMAARYLVGNIYVTDEIQFIVCCRNCI